MSMIASRSRVGLSSTPEGSAFRARAEIAMLAVLVSLGILAATALTIFGTRYDLSAAGLVATLTALASARLLTKLGRRDRLARRG